MSSSLPKARTGKSNAPQKQTKQPLPKADSAVTETAGPAGNEALKQPLPESGPWSAQYQAPQEATPANGLPSQAMPVEAAMQDIRSEIAALAQENPQAALELLDEMEHSGMVSAQEAQQLRVLAIQLLAQHARDSIDRLFSGARGRRRRAAQAGKEIDPYAFDFESLSRLPEEAVHRLRAYHTGRVRETASRERLEGMEWERQAHALLERMADGEEPNPQELRLLQHQGLGLGEKGRVEAFDGHVSLYDKLRPQLQALEMDTSENVHGELWDAFQRTLLALDKQSGADIPQQKREAYFSYLEEARVLRDKQDRIHANPAAIGNKHADKIMETYARGEKLPPEERQAMRLRLSWEHQQAIGVASPKVLERAERGQRLEAYHDLEEPVQRVEYVLGLEEEYGDFAPQAAMELEMSPGMVHGVRLLRQSPDKRHIAKRLIRALADPVPNRARSAHYLEDEDEAYANMETGPAARAMQYMGEHGLLSETMAEYERRLLRNLAAASASAGDPKLGVNALDASFNAVADDEVGYFLLPRDIEADDIRTAAYEFLRVFSETDKLDHHFAPLQETMGQEAYEQLLAAFKQNALLVNTPGSLTDFHLYDPETGQMAPMAFDLPHLLLGEAESDRGFLN